MKKRAGSGNLGPRPEGYAANAGVFHNDFCRSMEIKPTDCYEKMPESEQKKVYRPTDRPPSQQIDPNPAAVVALFWGRSIDDMNAYSPVAAVGTKVPMPGDVAGYASAWW